MSDSDDVTGGGLPPCPQCGAGVQPSWDWCHACGYDPEGLRPAAPPPAPGTAAGAATPPPASAPPPPPPPPPSTPTGAPGPYLPPLPPPTQRSLGTALRNGLVIGAVAVVGVLALLVASVTLLGHTTTPADGDASGSQSTAPPLGAVGTVPDRTPTTIGVGPCGPIPDVTPLPGPDDPDLLVSPDFISQMDVSALERTYGPLVPETTTFARSVDEAVEGLDHPSLEETRAELLADGYRGAALRIWRSQHGDTVAVLNYAVADAAGAQRLTRLLLVHACTHSSAIEESKVVPGALVFFDTPPGDPNGMPRARFAADVGDTEVNVTLCTCRPGDEALATAELWVRRLVQSLQAGRA